MTIGEQFKEAREALGLSQEDAGLIIHVPRQHVIELEADMEGSLCLLPVQLFALEIFIDLAVLLLAKKAPADLLHMPNQHYGGKSAIEYMKEGRIESILWVYSSTSRLLN